MRERSLKESSIQLSADELTVETLEAMVPQSKDSFTWLNRANRQ
jgi:hypothetical protein